MDKFVRDAMGSGFSKQQAEFLHLHVAKAPHTHTPDQIFVDDDNNTLEDALATYDEQIEGIEATLAEEDEEEESGEAEEAEQD